MELGNNMANRIEAREELAKADLHFKPPAQVMTSIHATARLIVARCLLYPKETLHVSEMQLRTAFAQAWDARQIYRWADDNGLSVRALDPTSQGYTYQFKAKPSTNDDSGLQTLAEPVRTEDA